MRAAFVETLCALAAQDTRVWLVTGDLGFSALEPFIEQFPDRYLNAGVAEQNMMGMAAGLAMSGKIVFVYSIANFPTMRCLEQIRNDVALHNANVKIIAAGVGFTYGTQGYTHYAIEDMAVVGAFANMTVVSPGDPIEARSLIESAYKTDGPVYVRMGRAGEPVVHKGPIDLPFGKSIMLRDGTDVTLIATGTMLSDTVAAVDQLFDVHNISARLISMPALKPLDRGAIYNAAQETGAIVTVEEHMISCGLGASVADALMEGGINTVLVKHGATPDMLGKVGTQQYMRSQMGAIADTTLRAIAAKQNRV